MKQVKSKFLFLLTSVLLATQAQAILDIRLPSSKNKVIYADQNIRQTTQVKDVKIKLLSQSVAMQVQRYAIQPALVSGLFTMRSVLLGNKAPICKGNPWTKFNALGSCSATLINHDTLLTAGHCLSHAQWDCDQKSWILNAREEYFTQTSFQYFTDDQILHCKEIISHNVDANSGLDYAIIKVDRKAQRPVLPLVLARSSQVGDDIFMIGHPLGLASMTSEVGNIRAEEDQFYVANLDSFAGNSGAPVFRKSDNKLTGMLVRGEEDFVWNDEDKCFEFRVCDNDDCRGEDIVKIESILEDLQKQGVETAPL